MADKNKNTSAVNSADVKDYKIKIAELEQKIKAKEDEVLFYETKLPNLEYVKNAEIAELKELIQQKENENKELANKLLFSQENNKAKLESDKPKYKNYQFVVDEFRFKGNNYKSVDAINDEELMELLINAEFFGLKKID